MSLTPNTYSLFLLLYVFFEPLKNIFMEQRYINHIWFCYYANEFLFSKKKKDIVQCLSSYSNSIYYSIRLQRWSTGNGKVNILISFFYVYIFSISSLPFKLQCYGSTSIEDGQSFNTTVFGGWQSMDADIYIFFGFGNGTHFYNLQFIEFIFCWIFF